MSGAFGRMLRCARSTAGSARPPPSRASPAAKFARSNVFLQILVLFQDFRLTSDFAAFPDEFSPPSTGRRTKDRTRAALPEVPAKALLAKLRYSRARRTNEPEPGVPGSGVRMNSSPTLFGPRTRNWDQKKGLRFLPCPSWIPLDLELAGGITNCVPLRWEGAPA